MNTEPIERAATVSTGYELKLRAHPESRADRERVITKALADIAEERRKQREGVTAPKLEREALGCLTMEMA